MGTVVIESLRMRNFKCFRDQRVPLGGLTVLAGLNGAGKSSVIQAILAFHQWWENLQEGPSPWRGPLVNLGSFRDVLHEGSDNDVVRIDASRDTDAERRRAVMKDPLEFGVEGLLATLAVNAKPRRWRPAWAL